MIPKNQKGFTGSVDALQRPPIKPAADNAGIAPWMAIEQHWPAVPELRR